jgi:hypothetical protein
MMKTTVGAYERLIKTIIIRLTDWRENFPMIPADLRPTTRVVDDLRSEAEALCIRVLGARTHLHGHGSKHVMEAEHLLSQVCFLSLSLSFHLMIFALFLLFIIYIFFFYKFAFKKYKN